MCIFVKWIVVYKIELYEYAKMYYISFESNSKVENHYNTLYMIPPYNSVVLILEALKKGVFANSSIPELANAMLK